MSGVLSRTATQAVRAVGNRSIAARTSAPFVQQSRGYAAGHEKPTEGHGSVNWPWEDPMNPGNWKEEHVVIAVLAGWATVIYGGAKAFGGGKKA
mmetsp:Transcript_12727/g.46545  ORF Transcript_12727/g.46545 Transcript_12727/m.46545 type:complete len:94 (-) Transcript_12727:162-443(-)